MIRYLAGRLLAVPPLLLGVSLVVFLVLHFSPGDPATRILIANGEIAADPAAVTQLRHQWRLDQSLPVQYGRWLRSILHGDFGHSFASGQSVSALIAVRLPATLALTASAFALALLLAIPLGVVTALYAGTPIDIIGRIVALVGVSLPGYWLGLLLVWLFAVRLHWLPAIGRGGIAHLVLPALTLATGIAATQVRLIRASLIETLGEQYVRVARAKGLREMHVVMRHALRTALIAPLTALGIGIASCSAVR